MTSAICFNLDQSKTLSSGNGLIYLLKTEYKASHHTFLHPYYLFSQAPGRTSTVATWLERLSREGGRGFDPRPRQTKVFKTGSNGFPPWR